MKAKFAKTDANKVERITSTHVSVEVVSGPSKGKAYMILATSTFTGSCSCSWGLRNGTTCSHVRDAQLFVQAEEAAKVAPVVETESTFEKWLKEATDSGDLMFASRG